MEFAKIFSILLLLSGTTTITLSAIVFLGNKKNASNIIFGILAFFLGWWSISYYFWLSTDSYDAAKFWVGMLNVGATFIPVTYYHWVVILMGRKRKAILTFGYLITIIFSLFSFSKFYFTELAPIAGFSLWPKAGSLYIYYILILYVGFYLLSIIEIIYSIIKEKNHEKRNVNKIILAAFSISLAAGASNFPLWYGIEMLPYGNFLLFFVHVFLLSYAMVKYNLMNMKALYGQLITGLILVTAFVDIFLSDSVTETIQKIFTFSIIVAFSYLLIKSSRETVKQKEELEILSKKLAKNNRKLKELDDAKNEFISITAHQLRTPPTVIKGYINMAQEDPNNELDDETRDALDRALISNERLIDLIEDILSVSRIESGKMRYEMKEDQDIEGVLEEIYESFLLRAQDKGLELVLSNPKERLPKIFMDGKKIREVISNLVDNAIKYTREGKVEIVASERDGNIRIEVKDTGVGVPREEMPYLFKKFSRGKNPGRLGAEGTGLGIFVGKKIVEDHGGKIWIESEGANKGSTFIIELPVRAVEQEEKRIIEEERREKIKEARQEKEVEKFVEEI